MNFRFLWTVFFLFLPRLASAYPELVRHGYPNCMACHISPTGGGVLTEYGRALSKELLSTWGREGEENWFWAVQTSSTLALGGDYRAAQLIDNSPTAGRRERTVVMQRDLEAAVTLRKKFTVGGTVGLDEDRRTGDDEFLSRRHYLIYQHDENISVRGGRFYPAFGLNIQEHTSTIRRGLGWDQNQETYNLEGAWQSDKWNFFATAILGRPDDSRLNREAGGALSMAYNPNERNKIGVSYYYGETDEIVNHYVGPYGIFGLSERAFILAQITATRSFPYTADAAQWGLVNYLRANYEIFQGFHVYLMQEFAQRNLKSNLTRGDVLGLGIQWFPRPHFELQTIFQKLYSQGLSSQPIDRILLFFHFYP